MSLILTLIILSLCFTCLRLLFSQCFFTLCRQAITGMADNEQKAHQLVEEARGKLRGTSSGFFSFIFGGSSKEEEGLEMMGRAANLYKMSKNWGKAGSTFTMIGEHHAKKGSKHDAATSFVEAANCFKKTDHKEASESLLKAIDIYTDMGRFTIAAKHHQTVAELFEDNVAHMETVIQHYQIAADYFKGEESSSSANKCLVKVAQYNATLEKYEKAIQIYEQVSDATFSSPSHQHFLSPRSLRTAFSPTC